MQLTWYLYRTYSLAKHSSTASHLILKKSLIVRILGIRQIMELRSGNVNVELRFCCQSLAFKFSLILYQCSPSLQSHYSWRRHCYVREKGIKRFIYSFKKYLSGTHSVPDTLRDARENQTPLRPWPPGLPALTLKERLKWIKLTIWHGQKLYMPLKDTNKQEAMGAHCLNNSFSLWETDSLWLDLEEWVFPQVDTGREGMPMWTEQHEWQLRWARMQRSPREAVLLARWRWSGHQLCSEKARPALMLQTKISSLCFHSPSFSREDAHLLLASEYP